MVARGKLLPNPYRFTFLPSTEPIHGAVYPDVLNSVLWGLEEPVSVPCHLVREAIIEPLWIADGSEIKSRAQR